MNTKNKSLTINLLLVSNLLNTPGVVTNMSTTSCGILRSNR